MKTDVKSSIADILKRENIEYVFGHSGGHIMHMFEAARNAGIEIILNKQEGNAVYMADGFTRVSGVPSVILGTAGPGATNMMTGISTAYMDSIPLVAICAGVRTLAAGRNAIQDGSGRGRAMDQRAAFSALCKQAMIVPAPAEAPNVVREAFRVALSGRPGPVYVEVPSDFWQIEIEYRGIEPGKYKNTGTPGCDPEECAAITRALHEAEKPLVIVGAGAEAPGIYARIEQFLQTTGIPYAAAPMAKNLVDEFSPMYLGVLRVWGKTQKVYEYMRESDFILFLGDRMQEWEMNWYDDSLVENATLAQIDPDPEEIGRVYPVDLSSVGSISSFVGLDLHRQHRNSERLVEAAGELWARFPRHDRYEDRNGIHPLNLNNIIEDMADNDAIVVCDTGHAKSMAIMKYRIRREQTFLVAENNGPMGYALPAALGAALASGREVICFIGDGGIQMSLNELGTALNYGLKVIFVVENNRGSASMVDFHTMIFGSHCAALWDNPEFTDIARAYGMKGYKVKTSAELEQAFAQAKSDPVSVLIEAEINQDLMIWE